MKTGSTQYPRPKAPARIDAEPKARETLDCAGGSAFPLNVARGTDAGAVSSADASGVGTRGASGVGARGVGASGVGGTSGVGGASATPTFTAAASAATPTGIGTTTAAPTFTATDTTTFTTTFTSSSIPTPAPASTAPTPTGTATPTGIGTTAAASAASAATPTGIGTTTAAAPTSTPTPTLTPAPASAPTSTLTPTSIIFTNACESWLASMRNANACSRVKLRDYAVMMEYVAAKLDSTPIEQISGSDIEAALVSIRDERDMSQRRHREMFQTVRRVLEHSIDNGWLLSNPCRGLKAPRVTDEVDRRSLSIEECARLSACLDRDEQAAYAEFEAKERRQPDSRTLGRSKLLGLSHISGLVAVRLMLATGMRRGEALGLTWENVDFEYGQVTVRHSLNAQMILKSPKTRRGIRTISVDDDTMGHLRDLKTFQAHALRQIEVEDAEGNIRPVEQTIHTPVFCNCSGTMYDPTKCAEWWRSYRASIGFPELRMHELRHTQATMLLGHGVSVKDVQARLGHASSSLTLDVYGHAIPANDRKAANLMGAICGTSA